MVFSDKIYNILKWVCLIFIPAFITFLGVLLPNVGIDAATVQTVTTIIAGLGTFIGALIGISNAQYTANNNSNE